MSYHGTLTAINDGCRCELCMQFLKKRFAATDAKAKTKSSTTKARTKAPKAKNNTGGGTRKTPPGRCPANSPKALAGGLLATAKPKEVVYIHGVGKVYI